MVWVNSFDFADRDINAEGVHVWPFDRQFPICAQHILNSGRQPFRLNRHDYFEVVYVHSGELVWHVHDQLIRQKAGELFVIGATLYHRTTEDSAPVVTGSLLVFLPELIRAASLTADYAQYLMPFLIQDNFFPHLVPADTGVPVRVLDLIELIHDGLPASTDRARLCVTTYLKMILVLLINHYVSSPGSIEIFSRKQQALDRLHPLFDFLERNYGEPVTVEDGARTMRMSKAHFMRFFKQVTGQPFINYLNHFRIAKAQELLSLTDESIASVSQEVGFCDQSYFGLLFRRLVHMTPLQYRQSVIAGNEKGSPASESAILTATSDLRRPRLTIANHPTAKCESSLGRD